MNTNPEDAVLFTDVDMLGAMNGVQLAQKVHEHWPNIELIVTSGAGNVDDPTCPTTARSFANPIVCSSSLKSSKKSLEGQVRAGILPFLIYVQVSFDRPPIQNSPGPASAPGRGVGMSVIEKLPPGEAERMKAVRRYDILDSPPDGAFDRITALVARRFGVPIAIISVVDEDRIWFKSHHGLPVQQIDREPGLCASAILDGAPYLVEDAQVDPRSLANPLVAGDFGLRFYAAVPLATSDGYNLGTLCILDKEPRTFGDDQVQDLKDFATIVMDQLELGLSSRNAVGKANLMAKEIDHRVMNSLQFVSGLLSMQSRSPGAEQAAIHLEMAANRVAAVAQVHRHFYADVADNVSCIAFLNRLCDDLAAILDREIIVTGDEAMIPATSIQALGLIANELVTNAAKHGSGKIDVAFRTSTDVNQLTVCDEGVGLPVGFNPQADSAGLGMRVVNTLAKQLGGALDATRRTDGKGACFTIRFPRAAITN